MGFTGLSCLPHFGVREPELEELVERFRLPGMLGITYDVLEAFVDWRPFRPECVRAIEVGEELEGRVHLQQSTAASRLKGQRAVETGHRDCLIWFTCASNWQRRVNCDAVVDGS